ncbi:aminopeptidase [Porphyromonas gingivicanis]|uniref:Aminopeptidase n=1 Tax=Porphyromonas gingivicanis TaxID=266762 RepID=A0A0A2G4Y3_9PORP|nr:C1 family peptidase [Porphyromonas gingivicanis]KGN98296.1 aminopeptidase [Porphyromonas gingivicanis]
MQKKYSIFFLAGLLTFGAVQAQETKVETNTFSVVKELPITTIKDQGNSGTCWSYSTQGFLEAELMRMGKPEYDLSDMFVVSHSYRDKAEKYVRLHGKLNFAQGGSFYDVIYVLKHYGAVPEEVMQGLNYGTKRNAHNEMEQGAKGFLDAIVKNPNKELTPVWKKAFNAIIDTYLGELPTSFTYKGKSYTPNSFAKMLGLNADDYVSLTSYMHHPFYSKFALEIEDNWRWSESYNLPIDELMKVMYNAVEKGYPIAWGADVSEVGFNRDGIGVLADVEAINTAGSDQARWIGLSHSARQQEILRLINTPDCPEIEPTQEFRQKGYDNYTLTDDHGMVIYGLAKNQKGRPFFMVKNSWGEAGAYKGIWYVSEKYVAGRTMNIVLHKDALPKDIAKKLGIR